MSKSLSKIIRHSEIDPRLESYETIFDHDFAARLTDICDETELEQATNDLLLAWKAAANTHALPWVATRGVEQYHEGFTNENDPEVLAALDKFAGLLFKAASLSPDQYEVVKAAVNDAKLQMRSTRKKRSEFDINALWKGMLSVNEFQLAIWGSQRVIFGAIFHEYEHFLQESLRIKSKKPKLRSRNSTDMGNLLQVHYDEQTAEDCWKKEDIQTARLIRNTFAHSGGRETKELSARNHDISVVEGVFQIMPKDNKALLDLLKNPAITIARKTVQ